MSSQTVVIIVLIVGFVLVANALAAIQRQIYHSIAGLQASVSSCLEDVNETLERMESALDDVRKELHDRSEVLDKRFG